MNIVCFSGLLQITPGRLDNLTVSGYKSCWKIMPASTTHAIVKVGEPSALTPKTIRYTPAEFKGILHDYEVKQDHHYKVMSINAIRSVRNLRLNHKQRRHKYTAQKRRDAKINTGIRPNNLIRIKKHSHRSDTNIIIGTCNTQKEQGLTSK